MAARKGDTKAEARGDSSELIPIAFRIERDILDGIDEIVADVREERPAFRGVTRSDIIRAALRDAIDRHRAERAEAAAAAKAASKVGKR